MNPGEVIGLIPAAGRALRLKPLPCSKELYPIGFHEAERGVPSRPKVVCHYLLDKMRAAGITRACIVMLQGKWDIPNYLSDGQLVGMDLIYRVVPESPSPVHTLDRAYPFTRNAPVAFGFPDILFRPRDAYSRLLARQDESRADAVLGVFPVREPHKWDMVELDDRGRVTTIVFKPAKTHLRYGWSIAVWTPDFSRFMHEFVAANVGGARELIVGDVLLAAVQKKLKVEAVEFAGDACLDIGTPEDLVKALNHEW
ncbi:MAG: nucleotidyltransferase family protein [Burkholderiales bacterium]